MRGGSPLVGNTPTTNHGSQGSNGTTWNPRCLHTGDVSDNLYLNSEGSIAASLERNVWLILGSSAIGTMLFYGAVYLMMRKRNR